MAELKELSCERAEGQEVVKTERKHGKRNRVLTVTYANEMPIGALEQALAGIYARKAKNGTLAI